jgi:hypothetical protein
MHRIRFSKKKEKIQNQNFRNGTNFFSIGIPALSSARRWAKIALIVILPICISICDSDSLAGTQNAQNEPGRMALLKNVTIPNAAIDHAALDHIPHASDPNKMTGRVRFQRLTAEPAKFRRIVNGGIRQFVLWDNVCPNSTNECGGFPIIVHCNCKMLGQINDSSSPARNISSLDVRNMFGNDASDPPQSASGPP